MKQIHRFEGTSHELFLRNYWYPLIRTGDVGETPVGIRRLGEDLVVWRDGDGVAHVFPDACPHRRARLSLARITEGRLECRYHGWQFTGDGQCTLIPTDAGDGSVAQTVRCISYPAQERHGLIWGFMALDTSVPVPPLEVPFELADESWSGSIEAYPWDVPWQLAIDNFADLMHAAYLHRDTIPDSGFPEAGVMRAVMFEGGMRSERVINGEGAEAATFHLPCLVELDFGFPPANDVHCVQYLVPVDAGNTISYTVYLSHTPDETSRELWAQQWDEWGRATQQQIYREDCTIMSSQGTVEEVLRDERPVQLDAGVMRIRRLIASQLKAERSAGQPIEPAHDGERVEVR